MVKGRVRMRKPVKEDTSRFIEAGFVEFKRVFIYEVTVPGLRRCLVFTTPAVSGNAVHEFDRYRPDSLPHGKETLMRHCFSLLIAIIVITTTSTSSVFFFIDLDLTVFFSFDIHVVCKM